MSKLAELQERIEPAVPAWAQQLLAAHAELLDEVRALRAHLAPRAGQPLDADARVGQAIAELALTRPHSACELFALPQLHHVLDDTLIDDARQLGALLSRLHKRGLASREPRRGSRGWRWTVTE